MSSHGHAPGASNPAPWVWVGRLITLLVTVGCAVAAQKAGWIFSPGMIAIVLATWIPHLPQAVRKPFLLAIPCLSFAYLLWLKGKVGMDTWVAFELLGYDMFPVYISRLTFIFGTVFHVALFLGLLFALHVESTTEQVAAVIYGGGTIGGAFAGDFITLFVFWELIAVASTFLIWARGTQRAYRAGQRYLLMQIASGLLLLAGVLILASGGHDLRIGQLPFEEWHTGAKFVFVGIGIKCAWPGVHFWLTDAYPEATPTGAVFLSAFTTKLAVLMLARCFVGNSNLIWIGALMAGFPIFYAVIENDLRRVLAYSLINQVGFMVVGVGVGTDLAVNGAAAHAFADVLFKGLLFMTMGAVLKQTGRINGSDLGGLFKSMPFTMVCCLVGAASISAFPLFSAFATKGLIMDAAINQHHTLVWYVLLFAAAGVFHHAGIKIPFFAFFAHDSGLRPEKPPLNMRIAMGLGAIGCLTVANPLVYGFFYESLLPFPKAMEGYHLYSAFHVVSQLQILFWSAAAFVGLMLTGRYPPELHSVNLDTDWLIRRPLRNAWRVLKDGLGAVASGFETAVLETLPRQSALFVERYGPERGLLREFGVMGSSILVVMVLLFLFLAFGQGVVPI